MKTVSELLGLFLKLSFEDRKRFLRLVNKL